MMYFALNKVKKQYLKIYNEECLKRNLDLFFAAACCIAVLELALLIFQYIRLGDFLFTLAYFPIYLITFSVSVIFAIIYYYYKLGKFSKYQNIVDTLAVGFMYMMAILTVTYEISINTNQGLMYVILSFSVCSLMNFSLKKIYLFLVAGNIGLTLMVFSIVDNEYLLYSIVLNYFFLTVCNMALTIPFYNNRIDYFNQKMEIMKSNRELEKAAKTDALTGVYNRLAFNEILLEITNNKLEDFLSVVMLDVDFFKKYNDYYGHIEGDKCLIKIIKAVEQCLRANDNIYRYGGEEFVVILHNADKKQVESIANRISNMINALRIPHITEEKIVTVSMGLHTIAESKDMENIIEKADIALYYAKTHGRKQYIAYDAIVENQ